MAGRAFLCAFMTGRIHLGLRTCPDEQVIDSGGSAYNVNMTGEGAVSVP